MATRYEQLKQKHEHNNQLQEFYKYINNLKDVIMRQTDYNEDTTMKKLVEHDLDVMKIVREYMNVNTETSNKEDKKSTNQMIYGEFRKFLDDAASKHYKCKELEELHRNYIQQKMLRRHSNTIILPDVTKDVTKDSSEL
jgi:hypothetical protein